MRLNFYSVVPVALSLIASSCAAERGADETIDARDACALCSSGKTDGGYGDITDAEGAAMLDLVNTAEFDVLDDEVGLDVRSVREIVATRPIETLQELDDISYIGPVSFSRILDYVRAHGAVDGPNLDREHLADAPELSHEAMAAGIRRGSYLARGIVDFVNVADQDVLYHDVPVYSGAYSIINDRPFEDIIDLHETFRYRDGFINNLADYVLEHGLVPCCGDGELYDVLEDCDDGNRNDRDDCSNTCQATFVCGDGELEHGEECDDGNTADGDGCSATCSFEAIQYEPDPDEGVHDLGELADHQRIQHELSTNDVSGRASEWRFEVRQEGKLTVDFAAETEVMCSEREHAGWPLEPVGPGQVDPTVRIVPAGSWRSVASFSGGFGAAELGTEDASPMLDPGTYNIEVWNDLGCQPGQVAQPGLLPYMIDLRFEAQ